jgi:hypothetical protein
MPDSRAGNAISSPYKRFEELVKGYKGSKGEGNRTGVAASVALLRRIRVQIALCLFGDGKGVLGHVELEACELWGVSEWDEDRRRFRRVLKRYLETEESWNEVVGYDELIGP